jgi:hypothetical protein
MNGTPPEANTEYSRGEGASEGALATRAEPDSGASGAAARGSEPLSTGLFGIALLGALMLLVAEFTTLFTVHVSGSSKALQSTSAGSHHAYAMALIAVCAVILAFAVWRARSRPALLGLGVLGVVALVIALLGDLPDATSSGLLLTSSHFVEAKATPSAGFFIETIGALLLVIACVWGLLLAPPPPRPPRRRSRASSSVSS